MAICKTISIKWKEESEVFKKFNDAKKKYDEERKKKGDKVTSCVEFAEKIITQALNNVDKLK